MKISTFIVAILVLFSFEKSQGQTVSQQSSNSIHQAYEQLLKIKCFAFGGVGRAGVTSNGEIAFRVVLSSTNALELFTMVLSKGTEEAKLYAICGIRSLNNKAFDNFAKALKETDSKITTMSGCLGNEEKASVVIKRIEDGYYDNLINSPAR